MRLEWDARKGRENLRKHGVSFEEASSVFLDRKSTRLNSSHSQISYGAFCLKKEASTPDVEQALDAVGVLSGEAAESPKAECSKEPIANAMPRPDHTSIWERGERLIRSFSAP